MTLPIRTALRPALPLLSVLLLAGCSDDEDTTMKGTGGMGGGTSSGNHSDDEDGTTTDESIEAGLTAEIEGLEDYDAWNVNAVNSTISGSLTIKAQSDDTESEDDGRWFTLGILGGFEGNPGTFSNEQNVLQMRFNGLPTEGSGNPYELEDGPAEITITEFSEDLIVGTFEGTLVDSEGNTITVSNGRFNVTTITSL